MKDTLRGARYLLQGWTLIRRPGLRRFVVAPLAINAVLFGFGLWLAGIGFADLMDWLFRGLPGWLDWLRYLLWPLFAIGALVVVFYTFSLVANLVGAPFNGLLAEAVERELTGRRPADAGWGAVLRELVPALLTEVRKLGYFLLWAVPLGILFLIPVVNLAAPLLWAAFSAWMLSLEYMDYPMGNHSVPFTAQRRRLRERRLLALGFGGTALAFTLVPVVNFLVMPIAVAGATVMWVEEFQGPGSGPGGPPGPHAAPGNPGHEQPRN